MTHPLKAIILIFTLSLAAAVWGQDGYHGKDYHIELGEDA